MSGTNDVISNDTASLNEELFVYVRRQPSDYRIAKYKLSDFKNPGWRYTSGGIQTTFMGTMSIYGKVWCNGAIEGEVAHSGVHGICPHEILVCVLKKDNPIKVYNRLKELVGPNPDPIERSKPTTGNFCKVDIMELLEKEGTMRKVDIVKKMMRIGHGENNINAVIKKLLKAGNIKWGQCPKDNRFYTYTFCKPLK